MELPSEAHTQCHSMTTTSIQYHKQQYTVEKPIEDMEMTEVGFQSLNEVVSNNILRITCIKRLVSEIE